MLALGLAMGQGSTMSLSQIGGTFFGGPIMRANVFWLSTGVPLYWQITMLGLLAPWCKCTSILKDASASASG